MFLVQSKHQKVRKHTEEAPISGRCFIFLLEVDTELVVFEFRTHSIVPAPRHSYRSLGR